MVPSKRRRALLLVHNRAMNSITLDVGRALVTLLLRVTEEAFRCDEPCSDLQFGELLPSA